MKSFCLLVTLSLFIAQGSAQAIEELTIDKEVIIFVKKYFKELKSFQLGIRVIYPENQIYLDSLEYSPWYVGDFNEDGLVDLFIAGQEKKKQTCYLILAQEDPESFELIPIQPKKQKGNFQVPIVEDYKKIPIIIYKQFTTEVKNIVKNGMPLRLPNNYNDYYKMAFIRKDTFVYKFEGLVEYNEFPILKPIRYLQFHDFCQFGGCPDYKLKIDSLGDMILYQITTSLDERKVFQATLSSTEFNNLQKLVNYLKLNNKESKYGSSDVDMMVTLQIAFQDGTEIRVIDYENGGTFGLELLYNELKKIKTETNWD